MRGEPRFGIGALPKYASCCKIIARLDLEDPHHAKHGIASGDDGARSEFHLFAHGAQGGADGIDLATVWQETHSG